VKHWEKVLPLRRWPLLVVLLWWFGGSAGAQDCLCPELTQVTVQGGNCNLVNGGACTVCDSTQLTFSITMAEKLPGGGAVRWYSDTDPAFDPRAGQGTLRHPHVIPNIVCNLGNQVKINEFQPWPAIADNNFADSTTGEWVELIGPPGAYLGCYIVTDGDWTVTIPPGTVMPASGLFVIGYAQYGPVDLDVGTCKCANSATPFETLVLDNQGEYLVLWNGFSYVDAVRYGNPALANNPPFGNLVTLGQIPTAGVMGCATQLNIGGFPATFANVPALPLQDHTYEREPDMTGPWIRESCGSRGRCNVDIDLGLPLSWTFTVPESECGKTLYFKAIIEPTPAICLQGNDGIAAGPFAITVNCPQTTLSPTLCPGQSLVINGQVYDQQRPSGVEVFTGFHGCDSLVFVELQFSPAVSVQFLPDTVICRGDSLLLTLGIQGDGPFQFALAANGLPLPPVTSGGTYSRWVSPADTTGYSIAWLQDANGCSHVLFDEFTLAVNDPFASLALDEVLICQGDSTVIRLNYGAGAPFQTALLAGQDTINLQGGPLIIIPVFPSDTTIYRFLEVRDHRGCLATLGLPDTLAVTPAPDIVSLEVECSADMSSYTIRIGLDGGIPAGYAVSGAAGMFAGPVWTSGPLPSKSTYSLTVSDGGPCRDQVLSGLVDCDCTTDAGVLAYSDTLQICPGESSAVSFTSQPVLEGGDTLLYLLFTNPLNPLGSLLASNASGVFGHQAGWPTGQVLWLASAVSRAGPGGLDSSDPCLRFSEPLPLVFRLAPSIQYTLPEVLCGEDCVDLDLSISGTPPTLLDLLWGDPASPQSLSSPSADGQHQITLCGDAFAGDLFFQVASFSDRWCPGAAPAAGQVAHRASVVLDYRDVLCAGDSVLLHGRWFNGQYLRDTFRLTQTQPDGCDTLVRVDLAYTQPSQGLLQQTLCEGGTLLIGGQTFDQNNPAGQVLLPGAAASGCDSVVTVDLTFTSFVLNNLSPTLCAGDTLRVGNQDFHAGNPSGTVVFNAGSHLGCDSIVAVNLSFHPLLELALSGGGALCPGQTVPLNLSGTAMAFDLSIGLSGGGETISFSGVTPGQALSASPTASGYYILLSASVPGVPCPVSLAGGAQIDVENLQTTIQAVPAYQGEAISCAGASDGRLTVNVTGSVGPFSYQWDNGTGAAQREGLPAGTYAVTVTSPAGCTDTDTFLLNGPQPLRFRAEALPSACEDGYLAIRSISGGTGAKSWSLDALQWTPLGQPPYPAIRPGAGTYLLRIRDANDCRADTLLVVPDGGPAIQLTAGPDTTIYLGQTVTLGFSSSVMPASLDWSPPRWLDCAQCPAPRARPTATTVFTLRITDEDGCTASATVTVEVLDDADFIFIPNVFSPNFDGINDQFLPLADPDIYRIVSGMIYDRWGNELWVCQDRRPGDLQLGWDGSSRGRPLENGVYVYAFVIRNLETGAERTFRGDILLMR
jgi:gliding motility-associated-like protein